MGHVQVAFFNILNPGEMSIECVKSETDKNNIYNLKGERINQPKKGVYIVDGKKQFIK